MILSKSFRFLFGFVCLILLSAITVFPSLAQQKKVPGEGIRFTEKKWTDILRMARQRHKPIFVDAYAIWCAPCQEMKKQTFTDKKVGDYFNAHFINVSLDVEKGEGIKLDDQYEISSYPTLLFLDENGKLIRKSEGFLDVKQILEVANQYNK